MNPPMDEWRKRLRARIDELGLTDAQVCSLAGVNGSMLNSIFEKGTNPGIDKLLKLTHALGITLYYLFGDGPLEDVTLSIQHRILANEMWVNDGAGAPKELPLAFLAQDLATLEVETNDYRSFGYRRGDVVSGERSFGQHIDNLVGCDCIIETSDGKRYFKVLAKGTVKGRYTLKSFEPKNEDIKDVKVAWAAPVQIIVRGMS